MKNFIKMKTLSCHLVVNICSLQNTFLFSLNIVVSLHKIGKSKRIKNERFWKNISLTNKFQHVFSIKWNKLFWIGVYEVCYKSEWIYFKSLGRTPMRSVDITPYTNTTIQLSSSRPHFCAIISVDWKKRTDSIFVSLSQFLNKFQSLHKWMFQSKKRMDLSFVIETVFRFDEFNLSN
jgi:hypothetical protein